MSQSDDVAKKSRLPRWAWVLLLVSLALNLLIAGAVVGSFWAHHSGHGKWGKHWSFFRELPPERRQELKSLLREARKPARALWRNVRQIRRDIAEQMRAEPFDEAKLREKLKALSEAEREARAAGQETVINIMKGLSPAERRWFAKMIEHRHFRRGRHGPPPHRGGGPLF